LHREGSALTVDCRECGDTASAALFDPTRPRAGNDPAGRVASLSGSWGKKTEENVLPKLLAIPALFVLVSDASAATILEPFDYDPGSLQGNTLAATGRSWLRAGTADPPSAINVINGSLAATTGLPASTGNAVAITGSGNGSGSSERLAITTGTVGVDEVGFITSGTVYYSFLLNVSELTGSNNTIGGFFTGLNNTGNSSQPGNPTVVGARVQARIDPGDATKYNIGVFANHAATSGSSAWSPALAVGDTLLVVGAYTFNTGASSDDVASLWINPDSATFGGTPPSADRTDTGGTDLAQIGSIILRQSPAPYLTMDELRIGTSWAEVTSNVVPEPASLALITILGSASLCSRRRRV
jgi:hypothetical protein